MKYCLSWFSQASTQLPEKRPVCYLLTCTKEDCGIFGSLCACLVCGRTTAGYATSSKPQFSAMMKDSFHICTLSFVYSEVSPESSYVKKWRNTRECTRFHALNCLPTSWCYSSAMCPCMHILEWNIFAISATNHTFTLLQGVTRLWKFVNTGSCHINMEERKRKPNNGKLYWQQWDLLWQQQNVSWEWECNRTVFWDSKSMLQLSFLRLCYSCARTHK